MFNHISIQTKLLSALTLIIVISVVSGSFVLYSVINAGKAVKEVEHISQIRSYISEIEDTSLSTHAYMTSFLNSGDLQQKEQFEKGSEQIFILLDSVVAKVTDPILLENMAKFSDNFKTWQDTIGLEQVKFMGSPSTVDMARLLEASEENEALWAKIRENFKHLSDRLLEQTSSTSSELDRIMIQTNWASVAGLVLTVLTTLAASVFIVFMVSRPLQSLVVSTNALVQKQWDTQIDGTGRGDEIGQMASALVLFRDNGVENEKLMAVQGAEDEKQLARARNIEELVNTFRDESTEVTNALENATQKMSASSLTMSDIANDTNRLSEEVSRSAESAGSNVNNVSAATEELTASIQEISQQLSRTNGMALDAKSISQSTVDKMKVLESSAHEIGSVIEIISDIAEQTNLLALNATIEAARAGDAGKGFAVVAGEVKVLASETAKATEQVRTQIGRIQADTSEAVDFIEKISSSIESLTVSMTAIAAAMEEQTAATQEIGRNVSEASQGTNTVVQNISDVSKATRQTQETSKSVSDIADELKSRSDTLKKSINMFLSNIKKA